jgi:hypothetical protein
MAIPVKTCKDCGEAFPATTEFFHADKYGRGGLNCCCRPCANARQRTYRHATCERRSAKRRRDWEQNNDDATRKQREYRATHPEVREKVYRHHCQWATENPDRVRELVRRYRAHHREQTAAWERNRRARKRGNGGTHTTADVAAQYKRQSGKCYWCGWNVGETYHVDHVVPLALGGSNGSENLVISCPMCNIKKSSKHPIEFAGRLC